MLPEVRSLFEVRSEGRGELIQNLLEGGEFWLERIVSFGEASATGFWYDQERPEWVALLRGRATLQFEDGTLTLGAGDCVLIPAHLKHRVAGTTADAVWLAIHYKDSMRPEADKQDY